MSLAITELELTDVNTISIPTDAILILSLLIIFALLGYFFHNILNTQTKQFVEQVANNSNIELDNKQLEDQLILESTPVNQERLEKSNIKKLNDLPPSKLLKLKLGGMAVLAIGGASLLGIHSIQNSYKEVKTSQVKIKAKNKSTKTFISMIKLTSSEKGQTKIKKISYVDPLLSSINSSKNNNIYQFKSKRAEDFFSF